MNQIKNFLYGYMRKGRLREAMDFFWNIIIMFQEKNKTRKYPYLDELKTDLVLKSAALTELKRKKIAGVITDEQYSTETRKLEKIFLSILEDENKEIPVEFVDFTKGLNYSKISHLIHGKLEYGGDNSTVIAILPFLNIIGKFVLERWSIIVVCMLIFGIIYIRYNRLLSKIETTQEPPIILSIYPNDKDGFGELHFKGLEEGVRFFEDKYHRDIKIISLNQASLNEMKNNEIDIIKDRLSFYLKEKNILAIHGPPVTECTADILNIIYDSGKNIPVFITSAAPKKLVQWDEIRTKVPLFRISTGVDDRAQHIANFIDDLLINHRKKMILLIEGNENDVQTFGEKFFKEVDELSRNLNEYTNNTENSKNRIEVIKFKRNKLPELANKLKKEGYIYDENVIYLLGVGSQFEFLVDELYKKGISDRAPRAQFGGWMNSYVIDKNFRKGDYYLDRLFEITDLYIDYSVPMNERQRNFEEVFDKKINPSMRDQAFSFDIGYVIYEAYNKLCENHQSALSPGNYLKIDNQLRSEFEAILGSISFEGVSGSIGFDLNKGGINQKGKLQYSRFNPNLSVNDWQVISYEEIFSK